MPHTHHDQTRREFLETSAATALTSSLVATSDAAVENRSTPAESRKRIAIITTLWASFRQALSDENQPG